MYYSIYYSIQCLNIPLNAVTVKNIVVILKQFILSTSLEAMVWVSSRVSVEFTSPISTPPFLHPHPCVFCIFHAIKFLSLVCCVSVCKNNSETV